MTEASFVAVKSDVANWLQQLANSRPANPFCTPEFFEAMRRLRLEVWMLAMHRDGQLVDGCGAFLRSGRLNRSLEIVSLPFAARDERFRDGLQEFCRRQHLTQLILGTFASPHFEIPSFAGESLRTIRTEYALDLTRGDVIGRMHSKHRYSIRRAEQAGLTVRRTIERSHVDEHLRQTQESLERRRQRGESIAAHGETEHLSALLSSGAAELFQVVRGAAVLSSAVVLRAPRGAYLQSAGTSAEGLAVGASHFLIAHVAKALQSEGADVFNLGGAAPGSSLAKFKIRFGTESIPLVAVDCYVGPAWRRKVTTGIRLLTTDRRGLARALSGQISAMIVYSRDTRHRLCIEMADSLQFRKLTEDDLRALVTDDAAFRNRQTQRLDRYGQSYAYGIFVEGALAHVSWLLPASAVRLEQPDLLRLRDDEAEITACETLPKYRGQRLYPTAIRNLIEAARLQGIRRVFMKTTRANRASRAGISTAGLERVGVALTIRLPALPGHPFVLRFVR